MLEQSVHKTAADREVAGGLEIKGIDCLCLRNPCPLISDTPLSLILGGERPLVQTNTLHFITYPLAPDTFT